MVITDFWDGNHKQAIKADVMAMVNMDGKIIPSPAESLLDNLRLVLPLILLYASAPRRQKGMSEREQNSNPHSHPFHLLWDEIPQFPHGRGSFMPNIIHAPSPYPCSPQAPVPTVFYAIADLVHFPRLKLNRWRPPFDPCPWRWRNPATREIEGALEERVRIKRERGGPGGGFQPYVKS